MQNFQKNVNLSQILKNANFFQIFQKVQNFRKIANFFQIFQKMRKFSKKWENFS